MVPDAVPAGPGALWRRVDQGTAACAVLAIFPLLQLLVITDQFDRFQR